MTTLNRYVATCHACNKTIQRGQGIVEFIGRRLYRQSTPYKIWCLDCFNKSDNSGPEDRCCGDRAYEDRCAEACGFNNY